MRPLREAYNKGDSPGTLARLKSTGIGAVESVTDVVTGAAEMLVHPVNTAIVLVNLPAHVLEAVVHKVSHLANSTEERENAVQLATYADKSATQRGLDAAHRVGYMAGTIAQIPLTSAVAARVGRVVQAATKVAQTARRVEGMEALVQVAGKEAAAAEVAQVLQKATFVEEVLAAEVSCSKANIPLTMLTEGEACKLTGVHKGLVHVLEKPRGPAATQMFQKQTANARYDCQ